MVKNSLISGFHIGLFLAIVMYFFVLLDNRVAIVDFDNDNNITKTI